MALQTIAVIGATGNQGSGVVTSLLANPTFAVRAITTNPKSNKVQKLLAQQRDAANTGRLSIHTGDLRQIESLRPALQGCDGVFVSFAFVSQKEGETPEVDMGKALVDLVKDLGIKHFVYSSLPSLSDASGGKFTQAHIYEAKATIAKYAQENLPAATFLVPGAFYSNLSWPGYARREDDVVRICIPLKPETPFQRLDERYDIGRFAAAVFAKGPSFTKSKIYPIMAPQQTCVELAQEYEAATGEKAIFDPLPLDEALELSVEATGLDLRKAFGDMFRYFDTVPAGTTCYGTMKLEDDDSFRDLGVKASTLTEYLGRTGFRVPSVKKDGD
ncbi:hypothetical protein JCM6882_007044 [Rhodosporidiobolus microsporus]